MRKIGKFLIIVKAEWWVHGSSLYWLLYFCMCFKFSKRQSKKKKNRKKDEEEIKKGETYLQV